MFHSIKTLIFPNNETNIKITNKQPSEQLEQFIERTKQYKSNKSRKFAKSNYNNFII